ncbi:unnamed protein product [Chironomus riparius]|uniref:Cuticle protein n=1 Tax=Chironomus riparius TaxID=315576 RepID=A0A9N9RKW2_9DIPT|nr:unnamed protein product [Chironomus riparius]
MKPYKNNLMKFCFNILLIIHFSNANFGTPESSQYHIQTDEGPERFFKYQTDNGQFRKERRLQDGTVIGTNAWIDGFGYLRMNDYIADHAGYRIMSAKTVFVGKDRHIEEAMKMAKDAPKSSGVLVSSTRIPTTRYVPTTTSRPVTTAIPYSTPGHYHNKVPTVDIRPHSQPRENYPSYTNFNDLNHNVLAYPTNDLSHVQKPSIYYELPLEDGPKLHESSLPTIIVVPTSTPASIENQSHLPPIVIHPSSSSSVNDVNNVKDESHLPPLAYYPTSTVKPDIKDESHLPPIAYYPSSTERPLDYNNVIPLSSTPSSLTNELLPPRNGDDSYDVVIPITSRPRNRYRPSSYRHESSTERTIVDYDRNVIDAAASYVSPTYQNNPNNVPLFDRSKYQQQQKSPYYDGVGVTANGFRYFLPRQYQEETENKGEDSRDGSYGYIDPFGIRRVVYYNAGKNGFITRKNNRYVGFNATPYDPRPN